MKGRCPAAVANLIGHDYPRSQANKLRVPRSWMRPLGLLLGAGSVGLLVGIALPTLRLLAAAGLALYFLGALGAHVGVNDYALGVWAAYFSLAVTALALNLAIHGSYAAEPLVRSGLRPRRDHEGAGVRSVATGREMLVSMLDTENRS